MLAKIRDELWKKLPRLPSGEFQIPSMDDLPQLTYLEAAIRENLRLNLAPPLIGRQAIEDVVLCDGTSLAKGTRVSLPIYAAHRMKSVWGEDVLEFKPECWIDAETGPLAVEKHHVERVLEDWECRCQLHELVSCCFLFLGGRERSHEQVEPHERADRRRNEDSGWLLLGGGYELLENEHGGCCGLSQ